MWSFAAGVADRLLPARLSYRGNRNGNLGLATSTFLNRQPAQVHAGAAERMDEPGVRVTITNGLSVARKVPLGTAPVEAIQHLNEHGL